MFIASTPTDATTLTVLAPGSTTPRSLASRIGAKVYVKDFGTKGDGVTDDSAAIQAAINYAHAHNISDVVFEIADYAINSGLTLYDFISLRSENESYGYEVPRARLLAGATGFNMLMVSNCHQCSISGINFDSVYGNAMVGVYLNQSVAIAIRWCSFSRFIDNGVCIKAGGNIDVDISNNLFNATYGYLFDGAAAYTLPNPSNDLYGVAVGWFQRNVGSCGRGIRFQGTMNFDNNDFEWAIYNSYAMEIHSTGGNSFCHVRGNYFEMNTAGGNLNTTTLIHTSGNVGSISDNILFGDPGVPVGSVGIDVASGGAGSITGNSVERFDTGIRVPQGYQSANTIADNNFSGNNTNISYSVFQVANNTSALMASLSQPTSYIQDQPLGGHFFTGHIGFAPLVCTDAGTDLNLAKSNSFEINNSAPTTILTFSNAKPGPFWVTALDGNTTLSGTNFKSAAGGNISLAANTTVQFMVRSNLQAWKV